MSAITAAQTAKTDPVLPVTTNDAESKGPTNNGVAVNGKEDASAAAPKAVPPMPTYPNGLLQAILVCALMLCMFLVALDMSIIATAIPTITAQFHSTSDVGWYGSAFFMCLAAFQGFWSKAYKFYPMKIIFLLCILIFELGSLIVALAPSTTAVIAGRAVQGAGGAGVTGGAYMIVAFTVQPPKLPTVMGLFGAIWACASVLGPVLGGVFTSDVTWQWCFWINLPIGGLSFLLILVFFHTPKHSRFFKPPPAKEWLLSFDVSGVILILGAFVCILIVLQSGGVDKAWSSSEMIGLIIGFGLLSIAFCVNEWWFNETAVLSRRLMGNRTTAVLAAFTFFTNSGAFARQYNVPIFFQAVQGVSPVESGVRTLAAVLSTSLFSFIGSVAIGKIGYYQPFIVIGAIFLTVGSGMIYTLVEDSGAGEYLGYQIIAGIGMGLVVQTPVIVAQKTSTRMDMPANVAIMLFFQFVGGGLGISTAQSIMDNRLVESLPSNNSVVSAANVFNAGATGLRQGFPNPADLAAVIGAYEIGLRAAWIFSIVTAGISFFIAFGVEWKSILAEPDQKSNSRAVGVEKA